MWSRTHCVSWSLQSSAEVFVLVLNVRACFQSGLAAAARDELTREKRREVKFPERERVEPSDTTMAMTQSAASVMALAQPTHADRSELVTLSDNSDKNFSALLDLSADWQDDKD